MFLDEKDKRMQRIQGYLNSTSGQNAVRALGPLGSMSREEVLKQVGRIIPEDILLKAMKRRMGILEGEERFPHEIDKEPKNPGLFGEPLGSAETDKILEHIREMGLEA